MMTPTTKNPVTNRRSSSSTPVARSFKKTLVGAYTTVSDSLRTAREEQGLSLAACSETLGVQQKYLQALEQSQYSLLPGEVYIRLWIKKYAQLLGLDIPTLMINYDKERQIREKITEKSRPIERTKKDSFWKHIKLWHIGVAVVVIAVSSYLGFTLYRSLSKPNITFNLPASYETQDANVTLEGATEPGVIMTINQQTIVLDKEGNFKEPLSLKDGINTFLVKARKTHGFTFQREFQIIKKSLPDVTTGEQGPNN